MVPEFCMAAGRHPCLFLSSRHPSESYTEGTTQMSKPWGDICFHEQGEKLGEVGRNWVGSEHSGDVAPFCVSTELTGQARERAASGSGLIAHSCPLVQCRSSGKYDSENCLWVIISFWAPSELGRLRSVPHLELRAKIPPHPMCWNASGSLKSADFARGITTRSVLLSITWLCNAWTRLTYFALTPRC